MRRNEPQLTDINSVATQTDAYVHYSANLKMFRIGQVIGPNDLNDVLSCTLGYAALHSPGMFTVQPHFSVVAYNASIAAVHALFTAPHAPAAALSSPQSSPNRATRRQLQKTARIAKPRNAWILYRQDKHVEAREDYPGMPTSHLCKSLDVTLAINSLTIFS